MLLAPHKAFLTRFAENHFTGDPSRDNMLRLKLKHSLNVLENAQHILDGEEICGNVATMGRLAALYHDIGRFPQFAKYATFNDRESINHGRLGVLTMRGLDLPGSTTEADWRTIRIAIGQHNIKALGTTLPPATDTITRVVRDADKIDILKVMVDHFSGKHTDPAITHGYQDIPDQYSESIYETVMAREPGDYRDIQCANDFKLLIVGWVYDLNFATSIDLVGQRGLVDRIFSFLPKDEKIQDLEKKVNKFIHYKDSTPS